MLKVYGLKWNSQNPSVEKGDDYASRSAVWLNKGDHNQRRITRILDSLRTLGHEKESEAFLTFLESVVQENIEGKPYLNEPLEHWRRTKPKHPQPRKVAAQNPIIQEDGKAISKYYTKQYIPDQAYSDHAPVIYGDLAIWNIANQAHPVYNKNGNFLFNNHKFTNLPDKETKEQYRTRLIRIADAIGNLFKGNRAQTLLLQELPYEKYVNGDSNQLFTIFKQELAKHGLDLKIQGNQGIVTRTDKYPATINDNTLMTSMGIGRVGLFNVTADNKIFVSIHKPQAITLSKFCTLLATMGNKLKETYTGQEIVFAGDFNTSASAIMEDPTCAGIGIRSIHTTPKEEAHSAGDNGRDNPKNIDLKIVL